MTTEAETLAPHFAAIAHQLRRIADALECGSTSHSPKKAPMAENSPSRVSPATPGHAVSAERHFCAHESLYGGRPGSCAAHQCHECAEGGRP